MLHIPIENIYYLLCYAWNKLDEKDRVSVSIDDKTELLDLFAKVLINGACILLKRGIDRNYIESKEEFAGIKGKIELSQTLKSNLHLKLKASCSFDEFSTNVLPNQILFTTLHRLLRTNGLNKALKYEIKKILWMFSEVKQIELKTSIFSQIRLHRNNKFYEFIINVCQIIFENTLPSEQAGTWKFSDFTRDEHKMNQLFEAFIRNFYRKEQTDFTVKRENIYWQFACLESGHLQYLPQMQTDITLENKDSKIIIDAKYYKETMAVNYEKEKIKSANLYQVFSYLLNQHDTKEKTINASGILLYPTIDQEYNLQYRYGSHNIFIKTLNLNSNWKQIEKRLLNIINN